MTQIPMETMEAMSQIKVDELSHHGILGMKWYVRRFQKYPAGYTGDGKYVGPNGESRKGTLKEKIADKRFNKIKSVLDSGVKEAVTDGNKKLLNVLKPTMTAEEYKEKYAETVANGVKRAVKTGDTVGLKKYKNDMTPNEYKDARAVLKFNEAVNKMDTSAMNKQMSKIKNDDLKASAERISTITTLQKTKIEALKTESEASAKLAKTAKTMGNVADITTKGLTIYSNIQSFKQKLREGEKTEKKRIEEENEEQIKKAIKSGDPAKISKWKGQMTVEQLETANKSVYYNNKDKIDKMVKDGDFKRLVDSGYSQYLTTKQYADLNMLNQLVNPKDKG